MVRQWGTRPPRNAPLDGTAHGTRSVLASLPSVGTGLSQSSFSIFGGRSPNLPRAEKNFPRLRASSTGSRATADAVESRLPFRRCGPSMGFFPHDAPRALDLLFILPTELVQRFRAFEPAGVFRLVHCLDMPFHGLLPVFRPVVRLAGYVSGIPCSPARALLRGILHPAHPFSRLWSVFNVLIPGCSRFL